MAAEQQDTYDEFKQYVNMTKTHLQKWLASDEAKSVGVTADGSKKTDSDSEKSTGYKSGEKIVHILDSKKADLSEDDYAHMRKVVGYIKRHLKQKPQKEDIESSRWRYSLMNWGHDPLAK